MVKIGFQILKILHAPKKPEPLILVGSLSSFFDRRNVVDIVLRGAIPINVALLVSLEFWSEKSKLYYFDSTKTKIYIGRRA